jgi:PAS domain S-box-containing protein
MRKDADTPKRPVPIVLFTWLLMGAWTLVLILSVVWDFFELKASTLENGRIWAQTHYDKDVLYRRWNAMAGGVYLPASDKTPPNPYLTQVPERDLTTPSGRLLTLINPAYMTRQVHELAREKDQVRGHITSLKPIRPENFPDAWETAALRAFENGQTEVSSLEELDGQPFLRLMRPLITEKGCLGCHAAQGYKLGDIRGGISVAVPMAPLWSVAQGQFVGHFVGHVFVWLLGMGGIVLGSRHLRRSLRHQEEAEQALKRAYDDLDIRVQARTAELTCANASLQTEIAERQQAEAALRNNENFLSNIFTSIQDGISVLDHDFTILRVNAAVEREYGHAMPLVGQKCYAAFQGRTEPCPSCPGRRTMETRKAHRQVVKACGPDGETDRQIVLYTFPLIDMTTGQATGVVEYARDLSELKQAEEALRHSEEQLRQAQKMEAVGRLAGGVAHDFNNMLTAITGYADILTMSLDQGDPRRFDVEEIKKAADRAGSLTRQLLAFSRKQIFQPRVVNLNDTILNLKKMLRRLINEEVDLVAIPGPDLGWVRVDPGQIEQVIVNLVVNSQDAMPQGGKLTIETANVDLDADYADRHLTVHPGPHVMLAVSDSGVGMNEATKDRVFEPFFTTKEQSKGTGLGLSTVYGIVKQSGGDIWVYSEPGQGTTFKIYLPRIDEFEEFIAAHSIAPVVPDQGSETILLAEDEELVRQVARRLLERTGYTVLEAESASAALSISREYQGTIHLLLTDVLMPGMGGRELAECLTPQRPEMHVLFMSGHTENAIVHHGVLDPGIAFIQKPFKYEVLVRKVRQVLNPLK